MDSEGIKREFIEAYFEELESEVAFLSELEASGHDDEAQLLALVYLDGGWPTGFDIRAALLLGTSARY